MAQICDRCGSRCAKYRILNIPVEVTGTAYRRSQRLKPGAVFCSRCQVSVLARHGGRVRSGKVVPTADSAKYRLDDGTPVFVPLPEQLTLDLS
ncbi:MAG TPA: hypothetical protein DCQ98_20395 [Planctomycetaceae bacterium]|nr:hypothetical protein [Planctomycetaceae bacterium]HRF02183.1 hypothetical protein [Pirellulaceae bacterium]